MSEMKYEIRAPDSDEVARQLDDAVTAIRKHSADKVTILEIGPCEIAIEDGMLKIGCTF